MSDPSRRAADALHALLVADPADPFARAELACLHRHLEALAADLACLVASKRIRNHRLTAATGRLAHGITEALPKS